MRGGKVEVVDLGAEEGEPWVRPGRRAVVREPPERWRCGRGGKAAVHPAGGVEMSKPRRPPAGFKLPNCCRARSSLVN